MRRQNKRTCEACYRLLNSEHVLSAGARCFIALGALTENRQLAQALCQQLKE